MKRANSSKIYEYCGNVFVVELIELLNGLVIPLSDLIDGCMTLGFCGIAWG
jgi:hypothetical protein